MSGGKGGRHFLPNVDVPAVIRPIRYDRQFAAAQSNRVENATAWFAHIDDSKDDSKNVSWRGDILQPVANPFVASNSSTLKLSQLRTSKSIYVMPLTNHE